MMSQHLNSMLEHLKMGSLMSKGGSSGATGGGKQQQVQPSPAGSASPNAVVGNGSIASHAGSAATGAAPNGCANNNLHSNAPHANHHNNNLLHHNHNNNCQNGGAGMTGAKVADPPVIVERGRCSVVEDVGIKSSNHVGEDRRGYDVSRKRCSISVQQHGAGGGSDTGGGNSRSNYRELSPASLRIHRKSSHDIRNTLLGPDGEVLHLHDPSGKGGDGVGKMPTVVKPIKLKSIITKAESYDTMHGKASDVSTK
uniref:Uncharacterized protein n=1 Tax=Anopheles atroparvus TaxID=41427 RepID=A0A182IVJ1_ANOAO